MSRSATAFRQPWLYAPVPELIFILLPALVATLAAILLSRLLPEDTEVSPAAWFILVVCIDVAHVYSSLYRTYFDPEEFRRYRRLFLLVPALAWLAGFLLYASGAEVFWRVMAYLAVYHFIRQQYGFMRLYARKENPPRWSRLLDGAAVYMAALYPVVYWHCHLPRKFNWFVAGDFFQIHLPGLEQIFFVLWVCTLSAFLLKEIWHITIQGAVNLPKNLVVLGTAASWYTGIVLFDGDLIFTLTNVVAHGIPYMALVWMYGRKKYAGAAATAQPQPFIRKVFRVSWLPLFAGLLMCIAYTEEGIWDGLVWQDHTGIFPWAATLPDLSESQWLMVLVPLLAVPQITHYVIDGFIWKLRKPGSEELKVLNQ